MSLCFEEFLYQTLLLKIQEDIIKVDLEKSLSGGLGFSVIGGERGIFVKSITPGGVAELSGILQVGDRLLKVSQLWNFNYQTFRIFWSINHYGVHIAAAKEKKKPGVLLCSDRTQITHQMRVRCLLLCRCSNLLDQKNQIIRFFFFFLIFAFYTAGAKSE